MASLSQPSINERVSALNIKREDREEIQHKPGPTIRTPERGESCKLQLPGQNGLIMKETKKTNSPSTASEHTPAHRPCQTRKILLCKTTFTNSSTSKMNRFVNVSGNMTKYPSSFNSKKNINDRKRQAIGSFQKFSTSAFKMARGQTGCSFSKDFLDCNQGDKYQQSRCGSSQQNVNPQGSKEMQPLVDGTSLSPGKINNGKKPTRSGIEFGVVCDVCGAVAVTKGGLVAHQRAHREKNTSCKHCCSVFLTAYACDLHQNLHTERQTSEVDDYCECGLCGGSFISILYLELHLSEMHGPDALYDSQSFVLGSSPISHPTHLYETQSAAQLFRCGICFAKFTYSFNLDCHMALHTQLSYACGLCDCIYSSLNLLVSHCKDHLEYGTTVAPLHGAPLAVENTCIPVARCSQLPDCSYDMWATHTGNPLNSSASTFSDPVRAAELFTAAVSTPHTYTVYNSNNASTTAINSALEYNNTTTSRSASNFSASKASCSAVACDPYSSIIDAPTSEPSSTTLKTEAPVTSPRGLDTDLYSELSSSAAGNITGYNTSPTSATVKTEEPDTFQWGLDANHPQIPSIMQFLLMMPLLAGRDPRPLGTHLPARQDSTSATTDRSDGYCNPFLLNE